MEVLDLWASVSPQTVGWHASPTANGPEINLAIRCVCHLRRYTENKRMLVRGQN